ncbi:zinc-binding alcohol dehydrogenase family protein [Rhodococcus baikonurensis]|uniref:quinone oxidoreductase family protein n=1 Tax=Rhodococcus erythropolis group TaxID=2840174 RepID=UPI000BB3927D|nr:zinc-binding dehydrogenase [Rhodococcus erythropolis]PBI88081.1 Phthiocerol synthesis polyketide synthase type I PpsC [Rhodococcus erythropolis]
MKSISALTFGGPDVLVIEEGPDLEPGSGEVVVRIEASGVGLVDVLQRSGAYPGVSPGFVPGLEIAGVIIAVGPDVASELLGTRAFAQIAGGGYATHAHVPVAALVPLPDSVSASTAVALGVNAAVAVTGCERAKVKPGDRVLVRGAGGGIGALAVQTAAAAGALVHAVTSSPERSQRLESLGAHAVIDRTRPQADDAPVVDVVFDPVGGGDLNRFLELLAPNGRYMLCGVAAGLPSPDFGTILLQRFQQSLTFSSLSLDTLSQQTRIATYREIFASAEQGTLVPVIDEAFSLDDAASAHRLLESGSVFGKLILLP